LKKIKKILTTYKMCYIIALKNRENIKNKQNTQTIEQNRTKNDKNNKGRMMT